MSNVGIVLVVDDEKVLRDGCSRILIREGFQVLTATNGQEALDILASQPVNVILCDLKMPVMGAIEVMEKVNDCYPNIPVVIITGHGTLECAIECMKKGAFDFITKPFRVDQLVRVTQKALEKHTLERLLRS